MDSENDLRQTDALFELQRAVQLKLGGCLLRLQQYEMLFKAN